MSGRIQGYNTNSVNYLSIRRRFRNIIGEHAKPINIRVCVCVCHFLFFFLKNCACNAMQDELKRGDVVKSVQCYMHESGASEDEAREHIKFLMYETWKKMNKQVHDEAKCPFSKTFIRSAMDITRMSQCAYLYGDGYGVPDGDTKHMISSLIIKPIPLN